MDAEVVGREPAELDAGDRPGDRGPVAAEHRVGTDRLLLPQVDVELADDGVDHPGQAHPLAVLGGEDRDAARAQPLDLVVDDHAAPAADDLDVAGAALLSMSTRYSKYSTWPPW